MKSKYRLMLVFGFAVFLGALIWLLSPWLAGHREPWDAQSPYYICALLVAGFLPACFCAEGVFLSALGVWLGQVVAILYLLARDGPGNGLWVVGMVFLFFYSLWALAGATLGMYASVGLRRLRSHGTNVASSETD